MITPAWTEVTKPVTEKRKAHVSDGVPSQSMYPTGKLMWIKRTYILKRNWIDKLFRDHPRYHEVRLYQLYEDDSGYNIGGVWYPVPCQTRLVEDHGDGEIDEKIIAEAKY